MTDPIAKAFWTLIQQANAAHFTYNQLGPQAAYYALAKLMENAETVKAWMERQAGGDNV